MPTIEVNIKDIENMLGRELPRKPEELDRIFECIKAEVEGINGDELKLEIKGNDRPDTWSAEAIARDLKAYLGIEEGLKKYKVVPSGITVKIERKQIVRPYVACAVVKNINVSKFLLDQLIQLQEKISGTFGRNRKEVAAGVYDFDKIRPDIKYTGGIPDKDMFVPLGFDKEMTLREILEHHPKGKEFGHLIKNEKYYPIFVDSAGNILSMPPIINSNYSGKVTEKTKNMFVEVTGTSLKSVTTALNIMVSSLAERGGKIESVKIDYGNKSIITPDFTPEKISVSVSDINNRLGMNFTPEKVSKLLRKMRYDACSKGKVIEVKIPAYRIDIMHPTDIIEDVAIAYGYNNFVPSFPKLYTVGSLTKKTKFSDKIRELMVGFGFQEVMTFTLVSRETLSKKVRLKPKLTEVINPMSNNYTSLRNALIPTMIEFLSKNTHNKFPQRIFEVGNCIVDNKDVEKLACLISHDKANYTEIKSVLVSFAKNIGKKFELRPVNHPTFISGRAAEIIFDKKHLGVIGEVHPEVLESWKIEKPVVGFEVSLEEICN